MDVDTLTDSEAQTRARHEDELHQAYLRGVADTRAKYEPAATTSTQTVDDGLEDFDFDDSLDAPYDLGPEFAAALDAVIASARPAFMPDSETITVGGVTYTRAGVDKRPNFATRMRVEANRPLSEAEMTTLHHLMAYNYRSTVRGEGLGRPRPDTDRSFVCAFDTVFSPRTDPNAACGDFENNLDAWLLDGSPVRTTNRAGAGTKGTRAVAGLGDPDLRVSVYYDRVI